MNGIIIICNNGYSEQLPNDECGDIMFIFSRALVALESVEMEYLFYILSEINLKAIDFEIGETIDFFN